MTLKQMLVEMLRRRDQWLRHLVDRPESFRENLQQGLERLCREKLSRLQESFPTALTEELLFCLNYALANRDDCSARTEGTGTAVQDGRL